MGDEKTAADVSQPAFGTVLDEHGLVADAEGSRLPLLIVEPGGQSPSEIDPDSVILQLGDLLPDSSGEVVLFMGEDVSVNLLTRETITGFGIADPHVTATGVDVTGLHFYSFESGLTVYSASDILIINDPNAA
jgi:hypothetical protein